jgi:hypothetical protein
MVKPSHATYPPHAGKTSIVVTMKSFGDITRQENDACLSMPAVSGAFGGRGGGLIVEAGIFKALKFKF